MSVDQNEIDALLNSGGHEVDDDSEKELSVDEIVAQTLEGNTDIVEAKKTRVPAIASTPTANPTKDTTSVVVNSVSLPDTSALNSGNFDDQVRAAQKILFEVFSSIPDKKDRSRLLNWANDAFIKSKFF